MTSHIEDPERIAKELANLDSLQFVKIFNKNFSPQTLGAIWFGTLAAIAVLTLPALQLLASALISRGDNISDQWTPDADGFTEIIVHLLIPVLAAAVFGGRLGKSIIVRHSAISAWDAFGRGVKIALYSAIAWLIAGTGWVALMVGTDYGSRQAGLIFVLASFGFPFYAFLSGLGGILLRKVCDSYLCSQTTGEN